MQGGGRVGSEVGGIGETGVAGGGRFTGKYGYSPRHIRIGRWGMSAVGRIGMGSGGSAREGSQVGCAGGG